MALKIPKTSFSQVLRTLAYFQSEVYDTIPQVMLCMGKKKKILGPDLLGTSINVYHTEMKV